MRSRVFAAVALLLLAQPLRGDDWPQWRGPNRDGVWNESGVLEKFPEPQLKLSWRAAVGSGYCGPTVASGRVYVMDRQTRPTPVERVCCFDAATGKSLWVYPYECIYRGVQYLAGPRASVSLEDGRAYSLGTMGNLHCLDAASGKVLGKRTCSRNTRSACRSGASPRPRWSTAIGSLCRLEAKTAPAWWRSTSNRRASAGEPWTTPASYSAPVLIRQAGRPVLVAGRGPMSRAWIPATGEVLWKYPFPPTRMVINVPTPVIDGDRLFVTCFYDGSLMLRLRQDRPAVEKVWRRHRAERAEHRRPARDDQHALSGRRLRVWRGQLRPAPCLDAKTGDRIWEDRTAVPPARWATIHMVRNGRRMWMFNERGELLIGELSPKGFHEISRAKLWNRRPSSCGSATASVVPSGVCQQAHLRPQRPRTGLCQPGGGEVRTGAEIMLPFAPRKATIQHIWICRY